MTWNYRVLKETEYSSKFGELEEYRIIEVYYDENGNPCAWADRSENILKCGNLEELKCTVDYLKYAFDKPVMIKNSNDKLQDL